MAGADSSLRQRLENDDELFQRIIDTIPPKYYFDQDVLDHLEEKKIRTVDKDYKGFANNRKVNLGVKAKHKRHRLNPLHQRTVSQIVSDMQEKEKKDKKNDLDPIVDYTPEEKMEKLQERLQEKISALKAKRQGSGNKQAVQLKRNVAKLKQKERNRKNKGHKVPSIPASKPKAIIKQPPSPNVFNSEGRMVYSKFDLSSEVVVKERVRAPKQTFQKAAKDLQKREEKIQKLESESSAKALEFKNKHLWKQALSKCEGLKVKDNPELLKKSMKVRERHRRKSRKQWQVRKEQVEKKQQDRQDKRTRNIQSRKQDKLKHKLKRAAKKGRLIPGF